jgi:transcription initiation factor TFIIB
MQSLEKVCPVCGSSRLIRDVVRGKTVCENCGTVLEDRGEYAGYQEGRSCGSASTETFLDRGTFSLLDKADVDAFGRTLPFKAREMFARLREWDANVRLRGPSKAMYDGALIISSVANNLSLGEGVVEEVGNLFRRCIEAKFSRGRKIRDLAAACVYIACRECGVHRTLDDVIEAAGARGKDVRKVYRIIIWSTGRRVPAQSIEVAASRICSSLGLSERVRRKAVEIILRAKEKRVVGGRSPVCFAAAAVYVASLVLGEDVSGTAVADAAQVTLMSVRNIRKKIVEVLTLEEASTSPALLRYHPECPPVDDPNLFRERKFPRKLKKQVSLLLEAVKAQSAAGEKV